MTRPVRTPLLIDCDTGIDDALALLYGCASPEAEIVGVGCVAGNVQLPHIVRNTLAVLELAGRHDVEVAAGRAEPVARPLRTAGDTHGPTGLGYAQMPSPAEQPSERDAAALIVETARSRPGELTCGSTGPRGSAVTSLIATPPRRRTDRCQRRP